ncbi:MAG TPA: ABC transporter substrate-binding protein [Acidimicrobiales bacterium]|nr:ABC transporter substrate-binding protein [Acidimicrobiales bacterium]
MRSTRRRKLVLGGLLSVAMVATACGSSGTKTSSSSTTTGNGGSGSTTIPNQILANNSSGTPVKGGTLTMLGTGDVDYMDPNVSYYAIGYLALRLWSRQLYTYPAVQGQTTTDVPDLATAMPTVTNGGLTYSITIRQGAMWNTTPPRQVTAADVVLGVKRTCNPTQPFGGQPDFSSLIAGYATFCGGSTGKGGFAAVSATSAAAQKAYIDANQISGVSVDPSNPETVVFTLTQPTSYFINMLALPAFSPAPVEFLNYLPASNDLAQHTLSDGPYEVQSYNPTKTLNFVRNPAWNASTDSVRKAYVDAIDINETGNQTAIEQQILTNTPQADMEFDSFVPINAVPGLLAAKDPRLSLQTEFSSNPYVIFNTASPNNGGALGKVAVRQALEYALSRTNLIQDNGGPNVAPPLTHILPPGIDGASPNFDLYPYNTTKAKQMLASAGYTGGLTLKFLYRPASSVSAKMFQTIQSDLGKLNIKVTGVGVPNADFYTKYLEVPTVAKSGVWDLSLAGWSPDWYGNAAASFFSPLFDGRVLPPTSSNFGLFNDPTLDPIIDQALKAPTVAQAASLWHQADMEAMQQAPIFPITDPNQPIIHGTQVHNDIYMAAYEQFDPTNVWLSK